MTHSMKYTTFRLNRNTHPLHEKKTSVAVELDLLRTSAPHGTPKDIVRWLVSTDCDDKI